MDSVMMIVDLLIAVLIGFKVFSHVSCNDKVGDALHSGILRAVVWMVAVGLVYNMRQNGMLGDAVYAAFAAGLVWQMMSGGLVHFWEHITVQAHLHPVR